MSPKRYELVQDAQLVGLNWIDAPDELDAPDDDPRALSRFVSNAHRGGLTLNRITRGTGYDPGARWLEFHEPTDAFPIVHFVRFRVMEV